MDLLNVIDPPNRPMNTSFTPALGSKLHKDLIFIDVDETEQILVGSTNTSATFWEGSVQIYKSLDKFNDKSWDSYFNGNIISDGKILSKHNAIIIAENPFNLSILNIGDNKCSPVLKYSEEHMEKIKNVTFWDDQSKILTSGETYLSIWDLNENSGLRKIQDFVGFHTADITGCCPSKNDQNLFASTGIDRRLLIWDARQEIPAHILYANQFCSLTAVSWNPINPTIVAVGTEEGGIYFLDTRNLDAKKFLAKSSCFMNCVHKIVYSPTGSLAVCGNCTEINVLSKYYELIYRNSSHSKFVRGLSWANGSLYSCGFDTKICKHEM